MIVDQWSYMTHFLWDINIKKKILTRSKERLLCVYSDNSVLVLLRVFLVLFWSISLGSTPDPASSNVVAESTVHMYKCIYVYIREWEEHSSRNEPWSRATRWSPTSSSTTCSRCALALTSDQEVLESICGGFGGTLHPRSPTCPQTLSWTYTTRLLFSLRSFREVPYDTRDNPGQTSFCFTGFRLHSNRSGFLLASRN